MHQARQSKKLYRYSAASGWESQELPIVSEAGVLLNVNGKSWLSFACTPTDLEALAAGFLFNEGFIKSRDDVALIEVCKQEISVDVWLKKNVARPDHWQRTSGCTGGLTTAGSTDASAAVISTNQNLSPTIILQGMDQLLQAQELYRQTGGVHSSALSDGQTMRVWAEDIGRHNTIDKLAGRLLLDGFPFQPLLLFTTGRVSSEMLQKASRLGVAVVASRTSATTRSAAMAEEIGITLVGYARRDRFLVYTHPGRLAFIPGSEQVPLPGETLQDD